MQNRDKIPPMPRRDATDVWEQIADEVALLDAEDRKLSADDVRWCADTSAVDELIAQAKQRARTPSSPTLAKGSLQPLQVEVMGMDRGALLVRLALSMRRGSIAPPGKAIEALSDDELRQLIVQAEG